MIPSAANSDYPKFVADQVLTSDNLNDLFGFLDEQGRMTRTNLIGMGIVCGLQVITAADGSSITITKGVGVTSAGYLVSVPEITYTKRTSGIFDAVKCEYYNKFVDIGAKTQKFDLWELKQEAESAGTIPLTKTFLTAGDKIVLLFVELLEENNKNCDPDSCDDKGIQVTVNFRPLLIEKANVGTLLSGTGLPTIPWLTLPEIAMRRFDVKATPIYECLNIFNAYRKILSDPFLVGTQAALTKAYNTLSPVLADEFPSNPFSTLAADFSFLNDDTITTAQLIAIQYYYDLFADILLAYTEFRKKGIEFIGVCCPDDLFPRHLLLNLAIPDTTKETSDYRHYFTPSPLFNHQHNTVVELKALFKKLVLLIQKFSIPSMAILGGNKKADANIRITPSALDNIPLSAKSIPYYYPMSNAADALLKNWSPQRLREQNFKRNLSYHATSYNVTDDDIRNPLLYDLEPYNFLRIEGHIGKPHQHVVKNILDIRNKNRLPFELVALSADVTAITAFIKELGKLLVQGNTNSSATLEALTGSSCHFNDLELLYDSITTELTTRLSNEMKFFYDIKRDAKRQPLPAPNSNIPQAPLLVKTDPVFRFTTNTMGHEFEIFYQTVKNIPFIPIQVFFQSFGQGGNTDVIDFLFKAVLYYIEMLFESITTGLSNFNFFNFNLRYFTLIFVVRFTKLFNKLLPEQFPLTEEENDHLDALLAIAAEGRMVQLYLEFLKRVLQVKIMQQAGYYSLCHPGIQHKAGVPMGGTFIIVYHETEKIEAVITENVTFNNANQFRVNQNNSKAFASMSGAGDMGMNETFSPQQRIAMIAGEIDEKLIMTKDKMESDLKRFFKIDTGKSQQIKGQARQQAQGQALAAASKGDIKQINVRDTTAAATAATTEQRINNYLAAAATYLKNREDDELDEAIEDINDGVVIADFYLPYICCSDCPPMQITILGEPEKPNEPPVARPGDNISIQLPDNSVLLDGSSSSDPDGNIKTYLWEKESGPTATIETPNESKTIVSKLEEGVYTFKLTVTDDDGASDSAVVTVTVMPKPNIPPVAKATATPAIVVLDDGEGSSTLDGTGSTDEDGKIVSYQWTLPAGTNGAVIQDPTKEKTAVDFTIPGLYVFTLTVKDDKGATGTDDVSVQVNETPNQLPVAKATATPDVVILGGTAPAISILDGTGSTDPDGDIVSYEWTLPAGTTGAVIQTPNKEKTQVQFTKVGSYVFTLTVKDNRGDLGTTQVTVTVNEQPNQPPVAKASANPATVVLSPNGSARSQLSSEGSLDPDGDPISFKWTLPAGTTGAVIQTPNAETSFVIFSQAGVFTFTLTVTDSRGATGIATVVVTVNQAPANQPPVAVASANPTVVTLFQTTVSESQLSSTGSSDPDGDPITFNWSLPAGTSGANILTPNAAGTRVQFSQAGVYVFTLKVTDSKGAIATATVTVTVNRPPVANAIATPPQATLSANNSATVVISSAGSSDPDGDPITFQWSLPAGTTGAVIQSPNAATSTVLFSAAGTFVITLVVKDNKGASASRTVTVVINPRLNLGPTARATITPQALNIPRGQTAEATLSGTQTTDPEGDPLKFLWSLPASVSGAKITSPTNATTKVTFTAVGIYEFTLRVTDTENHVSTSKVTINVLPVPG